jgi:hypothetical protein
VSDVIAALPPPPPSRKYGSVDAEGVMFTCVHKLKPNSTFGKTGYKLRTAVGEGLLYSLLVFPRLSFGLELIIIIIVITSVI